MGCAFLVIIGGWFLFGIFGMWEIGGLVGMPEWARILVILLLIAVTWLAGDDT